MMPDVINLNRFRKNKKRQEASDKAAQNRLVYGEAKLEGDTRTASNEKTEKFLDGHELRTEKPPGQSSSDLKRKNASAPPAIQTMAPAARIIKHSMSISGHQTSISLEEIFWRNLKAIAVKKNLSVAGLVAEIDHSRGTANLSSAIRVFILEEVSGGS